MKITIICEVLGEANNGTTIAALNLIKYLREKGHDVKVVCPDEEKRNWPGYYILPKADMGKLMNWIAITIISKLTTNRFTTNLTNPTN